MARVWVNAIRVSFAGIGMRVTLVMTTAMAIVIVIVIDER